MLLTKNKAVDFCDKAIFFLLCVFAFFLPVSKATIETTIGISIFLFLIKKFLLKEGIGKTTLNSALFVYLAVCLISIFISSANKISARTFVAKILECAFFFFIVSETLITKKRLNIFFMVLFISSTIVGVDGIYQFFTKQDFLRHRYNLQIPRIYACFTTPNAFGSYLISLMPFIVTYVFTKFISIRARTLLSVLLSMLFICLVLTVSRGAWLGFFTFALFMSIFSSSIAIFFLILVLILVSIQPFCHPLLKERLGSIFTLMNNVDLDRKLIWQAGWRMFLSNPWIGVGVGTFMLNFKNFVTPGYQFGAPYAHNCYLQMAAETGIIGLMSFLSILAVFFYQGIKALVVIKTKTFYWYMLYASLAALLGYCAQMAVDTTFYNLDLGMLFWLILGIGAAAHKNLELESCTRK